MARTPLDEATGLTVADVIHKRFSALPAGATVAEVREWFAESTHRRIAVLADGDRFAGAVTREELEGELDQSGPAAAVAREDPKVAPDAPAQAAYELATATPALRVPVVDRDGRLIGVVGVTDDLAGFCGSR